MSAIIEDKKGERILDEFRWGLMPFWARDAVCADSDELFDNPVFGRIIKKQRCVIPCSGFFVSQTKGKHTQWVKISMRSGTFGIAGIYDVWRAPSGEELRTCNILMTRANSVVSSYHDRMPAILEQEKVGKWLSKGVRDPYALHAMLRPMDSLRMSVRLLSSEESKLDTSLDIPHPELA